MRAVTATAVVRPDHTLTMQVPEDIPPGAHQVVVMIQEEVSPSPLKPFSADWPVHEVGLVDPAVTFRREDMYGDDGR